MQPAKQRWLGRANNKEHMAEDQNDFVRSQNKCFILKYVDMIEQ